MCNVIERAKARSLRPPERREDPQRDPLREERSLGQDTNITKSSTACLSLDCFVCFNRGIVVWGFPGGSVVKNPPTNAGDARDSGLFPELGRCSLEKEMATHSSILT